MENRDVARILRETAQLLEIDGAMIGRYRSYEKAAELIFSLTERVEDLARDPEKLTELPGIGDRMAEHIGEILKTGDYGLRQKLLKKFPPTLLDLLKLQSLGPKKAALLWSMFQAATVEDVEKLAREGKLRDVPGFGEKTEQNILKAVEVFKKSSGRFLLHNAEAAASMLVSYIRSAGAAIESVAVAGSLRRSRETAGDLDLLVTLADGFTAPKAVEAVANHVLKYPPIDQVLARGENKVSFTLGNGMQVDVRLLDKDCSGAALIYFTGSKEHNVALRGRALKMGYTLNEYCLSTVKGERRVAGKTEGEIYAKLKLDYIPPELRENCGEIEAAAEHRLPKLICREDIRGDLQMHTIASDGKNSIEEMCEAARAIGHQYIAITDHSKSLTITNGLDDKRLLAHLKNMRQANARGLGIRLLAGAEVDILKDGRMDYDDELLAQIEVVVASVHSFMSVDRSAMTDRLLAAIENPYTQIIAHPTGRILLRRDPYDYDIERVLDAAAKHGVAFECNAYPDRLDLKDTHLRMARERGVKIVISTDAHRVQHLEWMRYGVQMARRGWIEKAGVLNALPVEEFLAALRPKPGAATPAKPQSSAVAKGRR